jgi:hypothetical protein
MRYFLILLSLCIMNAYGDELTSNPTDSTPDTDVIYQSVDTQGNITYSDKPVGKNPKIIDAPAANIGSSPQASPPPATVINDLTNAVPQKKPYQTFLIQSPTNEESIQNQPSLKISINLIPSLQEGDSIQLYLDGKPWGKARPETEFEFVIPERGTHEIYAELIDANSRTIQKTNPLTIYVHQAHLGGSPPSIP